MCPYMTSIHSSRHPHKPREEYFQELVNIAPLSVIWSNLLQHWRPALLTLSKMYSGGLYQQGGLIPTLRLLHVLNTQSIPEILELHHTSIIWSSESQQVNDVS